MKWCFISVRQLAQQFKRTWRKLRFHESRFTINGGGVEPQVSAALVQNTVERFAPIIDELDTTLPPLLEGYRVKILDGTHFSTTEHRLKELRLVADAPLPGKALVILEPQLCLATKVIPCEDGHAQERALLEEVLPNVEPADLWIGDRNFCAFGFMFGIHDSSGKFLLRQHGNVIGTLLDTRKFKGHTDTGSVYKQLLRLTCSLTDRTLVVRRILSADS